ncbi:MAG: hypothetical protein FH753_06035 [Firmicutes bacterium]|nr:hypothetical protein [Bacillota bacterium]MTI71890.1 hypothetical protein [Bacillota bacterium]
MKYSSDNTFINNTFT